MRVVFPREIQVINSFVVTANAVKNLCVSDVHKVILGLGSQDLLVAELRLLIVLLDKVYVGELQPRLSVLLVVLEVLIKQLDGLVDLPLVSVKSD
jgi:hypothetical protein